MEDQESLKPGALIRQFPDPVQHQVHDLLADGVVAPGVVVGGVLLARNELLGVKELAVDASPDLVNDGGLKVHEDGSWHVFAGSSFREESVEAVIASTHSLIAGHLAVRLNSMLETVKFPTGISYLGASLADVDRDAFPHVEIKRRSWAWLLGRVERPSANVSG